MKISIFTIPSIHDWQSLYLNTLQFALRTHFLLTRGLLWLKSAAWLSGSLAEWEFGCRIPTDESERQKSARRSGEFFSLAFPFFQIWKEGKGPTGVPIQTENELIKICLKIGVGGPPAHSYILFQVDRQTLARLNGVSSSTWELLRRETS